MESKFLRNYVCTRASAVYIVVCIAQLHLSKYAVFILKGNVTVYKGLNLEMLLKKELVHVSTVKKC